MLIMKSNRQVKYLLSILFWLLKSLQLYFLFDSTIDLLTEIGLGLFFFFLNGDLHYSALKVTRP